MSDSSISRSDISINFSDNHFIQETPKLIDYNFTFLLRISLTIAISSFIFGNFYSGYELGVLNIIEEHISNLLEWGDYKFIYITLSNTLLCIGAALGSSLTGKIANCLGRRKATIINNFLLYIAIVIVIDI